jgi:Putative bacterial sensory transduction regulator
MADQAEWFRAFVERSLQQVWESPGVVQDGDGDYPFGDESTTAYVTVEEELGLAVCVWSYAACGVKGTVSVLREVNDLNISSRLCKVMWRDGVIRVELRLPADQVSVESLERACGHVEGVASDIGQMFAVVHGGVGAPIVPRAS